MLSILLFLIVILVVTVPVTVPVAVLMLFVPKVLIVVFDVIVHARGMSFKRLPVCFVRVIRIMKCVIFINNVILPEHCENLRFSMVLIEVSVNIVVLTVVSG